MKLFSIFFSGLSLKKLVKEMIVPYTNTIIKVDDICNKLVDIFKRLVLEVIILKLLNVIN
jgi:hypothetical protein